MVHHVECCGQVEENETDERDEPLTAWSVSVTGAGQAGCCMRDWRTVG